MKKFLLLLFVFSLTVSLRAQTPLTTAVDFTVTTVEGPTFNLFNKLAENKYVVIDFFYYACGPCQLTAPKANGAYEYFGCNTSNVYFIGIDYGDNTAQTIAFGTDFGAHYPAASGTEGGGDAVNTTYGITAYPTVIMIAPNHSIIEQDIWPIADAAYLYNLIQTNGGVAKSCPSSDVEENTDIQDINLLIMPNPTTGQANIYFGTKTGISYDIRIFDILGQEVYNHNISSANGGYVSHNVEAGSLATGTYVVKIFEDNNSVAVQKLSVIK
jgi:thiol-disulfide isomerase/thioredoxin